MQLKPGCSKPSVRSARARLLANGDEVHAVLVVASLVTSAAIAIPMHATVGIIKSSAVRLRIRAKRRLSIQVKVELTSATDAGEREYYVQNI